MCLIVLAIPVQGMAAVVMPLCLPAPHGDASMAIDRLADRSADHHHAAASHHAAGQGDEATPDEPAHSGHDMLKCCSAACSMVALTTPPLAVGLQARPPAPLHPVAQLYSGVTPDGLDRPPKFILA